MPKIDPLKQCKNLNALGQLLHQETTVAKSRYRINISGKDYNVFTVASKFYQLVNVNDISTLRDESKAITKRLVKLISSKDKKPDEGLSSFRTRLFLRFINPVIERRFRNEDQFSESNEKKMDALRSKVGIEELQKDDPKLYKKLKKQVTSDNTKLQAAELHYQLWDCDVLSDSRIFKVDQKIKRLEKKFDERVSKAFLKWSNTGLNKNLGYINSLENLDKKLEDAEVVLVNGGRKIQFKDDGKIYSLKQIKDKLAKLMKSELSGDNEDGTHISSIIRRLAQLNADRDFMREMSASELKTLRIRQALGNIGRKKDEFELPFLKDWAFKVLRSKVFKLFSQLLKSGEIKKEITQKQEVKKLKKENYFKAKKFVALVPAKGMKFFKASMTYDIAKSLDLKQKEKLEGIAKIEENKLKKFVSSYGLDYAKFSRV